MKSVMIPKTIHFIWLGESKKPDDFSEIMKSWEAYAPAFTIREWGGKDAEEFDLPDYYHRSIKEKKYAFASDVLRFHILERFGGIYLDVDEVLLKNIDTEELLNNTAFLGKYHESDDYFGFGVIGSAPNSTFSKRMVDYFKSAPRERYIIVNKIGSEIANSLLQEDPKEMTIFPQEYFYPIDEESITDITYGKHLSNTSWIPTWKKILHKLPFYTPIKNLVVKIIPEKLIRNVDY